MPRVARRAGLDVEVGQPLPLAALPTLWQAGAATRAAASSVEVSAHDVLLKELANVLLVRFEVDAPVRTGRGAKWCRVQRFVDQCIECSGLCGSTPFVQRSFLTRTSPPIGRSKWHEEPANQLAQAVCRRSLDHRYCGQRGSCELGKGVRFDRHPTTRRYHGQFARGRGASGGAGTANRGSLP